MAFRSWRGAGGATSWRPWASIFPAPTSPSGSVSCSRSCGSSVVDRRTAPRLKSAAHRNPRGAAVGPLKEEVMKRTLFAMVAAVALMGAAGTASAQGAKRPSVAVMDFDFGTVHDHWWGNYDIGKGMADQVVDALVNDGSFRVIERKKLDTVLAEQDFARSDRADPSAAKLAKVGKVLGVKYII